LPESSGQDEPHHSGFHDSVSVIVIDVIEAR
jgi:hypothetical protein